MALAGVYAGALHAQAKPAPGGTIRGHVYLADSDKPARFATVYLKPVSPGDGNDDFFTTLMDSSIVNMQTKRLNGASPSAEDESDLKSARRAATGFLHHVSESMLSATVSADGEYVFRDVPAGSYYLHVGAPGYIDTITEFTEDQLASQDPAERKKIAAVVTIVTVMGAEQINENQRLERGAAVSGRILFDDGSPAAGWTVRAIPKRSAADDTSQNILGIDLAPLLPDNRFQRAVTDDRGNYRIAGLPGGEFVLEASFVTAALDREPFRPVASSAGSFLSILGGLSGLRSLKLEVYSGNAARAHDADVLSLRAGEERPGTDLVARIGSTQSITGFVVSQTDGHAINSGDVELIAQGKDGKDDMSTRLSTAVQADGSFRFDYVPAPGAYTLRSVHASDTSVSSTMKLLGSLIAERKSLRGYAAASTAVTLGSEDLAGVKIAVTDLGGSASRSAPATH